MTTVDFPLLLKTLTNSGMGGRYSPVYLSIGFLSAALTDDEAREDLITYAAADPEQMERLRNLSIRLQAIIARADHANQ